MQRDSDSSTEPGNSFECILDTFIDGVTLAHTQTRKFSWCNQAFCRMLGYTREELQSMTITDIHPRESLSSIEALFIQCINKEVDRVRDIPVVRKDGTIFFADLTASPATFNGAPHLVATFHDITDRKATEKALEQSQELLNTTLDTTADGVLVVDNEGKIRHWNRQFIAMWKIPQEIASLIEDEKVLDFVSDQLVDPEGFRKTVDELYVSQNIRYDELLFKDGRVFERYTSPIMIRGTSYGRVWDFRDITKKKAAQQALEASEVHYRLLFENAAVAIAISREGKLIFVNTRFSTMFGYDDPSEVLGRSMFDFVAPSSQPDIQHRHTHKPYDSKVMESTELEAIMVRKDGAEFWIHAAISNVYLSGTLAAFAFITDITHQKSAQEALKNSEEEYRSLINNMQDAVYKCDLDGVITFTTPAAARILGYNSVDELIGKNIAEDLYLHPEERADLITLLRSQGSVTNYEVLLKAKNSTPVVVSTSSHFSRDKNGNISGVEGLFSDITDRRYMENKLRENERLLNELYKMVQLGHWVWNVVTGEVEWSDVMFTIFHLEPATYTPNVDSLGELSPLEEDRIQYRNHIALAQSSRDKICFEQRFLLPDNSTGYYQSTVQGKFDEDGTVRSVVGTVLDITERKRVEETLRNNEALLRSIFDVSPAGIALIVDKLFVKVNMALCRITGYQESDLLGTNTRFLYVNDDEYRKIKTSYNRIGIDNIVMEETRLRCQDGHEIDVVISLNPLNPKELSKGVIATVLDTTLIKKTEQAFRKSEAVIKSLFNATPVGLGLLVSDKFTKVNNAMCTILGYSESEIVGHSPTILFGENPHESKRVEQELARQIAAEGIGMIETDCINKEGRSLSTMIFLSPFNVDDVALGMTISILDITEFRKVTTEKTHLEEMLLHSQKLESTGRLAGGIAHDFNNILTAIIGNTEIVLDELDHTGEHYTRLQVVMEAAEGAANLTRQLLAFSRKQVIEPKVININSIIEHIRKMIQTLIGESITLDIVCAPDLNTVKADPGQVEQILFNLAANARDAMPDGGKLIIETANTILDEHYAASHVNVIPGSYVMMAVGDTGSGMSKEIQDHIFEPFYTTKEKGFGTGLGLATVYGIIKQSGGSIELYSEIDKGSIFKLYLPVIQQPVTELYQSTDRTTVLAGTETILIAEDNEKVLEFSSAILRRSGYTILTARSGEEALEIASRHPDPIHLFVTDVILPGINGRVTADKLALHHPLIKTLYTSGYTAEVIDKQGILEEGINFISKPFTSHEIRRKIREILDNS